MTSRELKCTFLNWIHLHLLQRSQKQNNFIVAGKDDLDLVKNVFHLNLEEQPNKCFASVNVLDALKSFVILDRKKPKLKAVRAQYSQHSVGLS